MVQDYCYGTTDTYTNVQRTFETFASAISKSGRKMQLGMWNLGMGRPWMWASGMNLQAGYTLSQHFRVTSDIGNVWEGYTGPTMGVLTTVDVIQAVSDMYNYGVGNQSGVYPNYGQLAVGVPPDHPTAGDPGLTLVEAQSHFSMWCMFPSVLLATNDVRKRDSDIEAILLNKEAIAINQDPWASPAFRINVGVQHWRSDIGADPRLPIIIQWARYLSNGDVAVLILNRDAHTQTGLLYFADFLPGVSGGSYVVRDVQATKDLGVYHEKIAFSLQAHQTAFYRLSSA